MVGREQTGDEGVNDSLKNEHERTAGGAANRVRLRERSPDCLGSSDYFVRDLLGAAPVGMPPNPD